MGYLVLAGVALLLGLGAWRMAVLFTAMRGNGGHAPPMTPATSGANPADAPIGPPGDNEDDRLDEALEESFPASDPVSVRIE